MGRWFEALTNYLTAKASQRFALLDNLPVR
jgi:hypothetical protein